jgi:tetratricopeptide (TPR) repeat protein
VPAELLARDELLPLRVRAALVRLWLGEVGSLAGELAACAAALGARSDLSNLALLACEEGRAWEEQGDLARAQGCWRRAESLGPPGGYDPVRANVQVQLGRLDHLRGHLASALNRYDTAHRHAGQGVLAQEIEWRRLLVRLEISPLDQLRSAADRLCADRTFEHLPEEVRPLAETVCGLLDDVTPAGASQEFRAYQAAQRGDVTAARSLYAAALAGSPSPERRARLALALGLLARTSRDAAAARSWLRQAEELARSQNLPEVLARALKAGGQLAAEQEGNDELARRLFQEAVLITEMQAQQFRSALDRGFYRWQRGSVLRQLLHSACRRGEAEPVFCYQERERGRLLLDLLHSAEAKAGRLPAALPAEVAELQRRLADCERELAALEQAPGSDERCRELLRRREELLLRRDGHFEEYLRDRGRTKDALLPPLPGLGDLQRALPPGVLYVAPTLADGELFLLAVSRGRAPQVIRGPGRDHELSEQLERFRARLNTQIDRYQWGLLGRHDRAELDGLLEEIGRGPLGQALGRLLESCPAPRRLVWVPDGPLHGLPIHAVRRGGRYLVEDLEFVWAFSGALFLHQDHTRRRRGPFRPAVVVTEAPDVLAEAEREGRGVAAAFLWSRQLPAAAASREAVRTCLTRARVAHFACHADFESRNPLASRVRLPSREVIHALDWLDEPVAGLPLVTLSACRSAEVAPLLGQEVFGLVTGLLGAGVRAVLAALWPVADRETPALMWRFYRNRLEHDLATALARSQRELLAQPDGSPLFWAAFALHGDAASLPATPGLLRWFARLRRDRHGRRFPDPPSALVD